MVNRVLRRFSPAARLDTGSVFLYLALGAVFSSVPRFVTEQLDGSKALAGLSVSVFFVAAVVARPVAGRYVDEHGRRPLLATLPFVVAAAMLGLLVARSIPVVLALRFVQGLAGGSFYVAAVTAETDLAPVDRRASAVARLSIAIYLGFAVGPALGEWLLDRGAAWTWTTLAASAAVGGLLTGTVPETRPTPVVAAGGDGPPPARPRLLHPAAVLPGVMLGGLGVGYASITALSALYARAIGMSSSTVLYLAYAGSIVTVRLVSGRLADRVGPMRVIVPGLLAMSGGFVVLAGLQSVGPAVAGVALVGTGWALVFPATAAWLASRVTDAERGAAMGTAVAFMDIGQGSAGYVVGAVADAAGFGWAYLVPAVLAFAGLGVVAVARRDGGAEVAELAAATP